MAAGKALTREDLIYILQGVFRVSATEDNGFQLLEDGFYTKDYENEIKEHTENASIHVDAATAEILSKLSVNAEGVVMYDGQFAARISGADNNGLEMKPDGLFVKDHSELQHSIDEIKQDVKDINDEDKIHHMDGDIHVTPEDKQRWDSARAEAREEVMLQMEKILFYDFRIVPVLPPFDECRATTIYLVKDNDYMEGMTFTLWVKLVDKWQQLDMPKIVYENLLKKTELNDILQKFIDDHFHSHDNISVIDKLAESSDGLLLYDGKQVNGIDPLEIRDLINSIKSVSHTGLQKKILYRGNMKESGKYQLSDDINKFSFIIIDYMTDYKPDEHKDGTAKSITVDPDTLTELYDEGFDYTIEQGYGLNFAETRFHCHNDEFCINYWNRITIFKITGYGEKQEEPEINDEENMDTEGSV